MQYSTYHEVGRLNVLESDSKAFQQAEELLDRWKANVIDATKRNILLNYRGTKTRHFELTDISMDEIQDNFLEKESKVLLLWEENVPEVAANLQTVKLKIIPKEYYRRLRYLRNEARKFIEETSINILYLAIGFIRYKDVKQEERHYFAPIILIPVELILSPKKIKLTYPEAIPEDEQVFPKAMFFIRAIDEDIVTNPALVHYFEKNFDLKIPEISNEYETITSYFESIKELLTQSPSFEIIEGGVLGFFTFHKFIIFQDLENNRDKVLGNHLFRVLAGFVSDLNENVIFPNEETIDDVEDPKKTFHILDADSSQRKAILAAKDGCSFVLQGPPGTGKSQTIANIISDFVGSEKTVLFMSEKKAALDVVYKRLSSQGLESYLLDLHSTKVTKKKEFYEKLQETLIEREDFTYHTSIHLDDDFRKLRDSRDTLNEFSCIINEPRAPLNKSLFEIYGYLALLENLPMLHYSPVFSSLSLEGIQRNLTLLEEISHFKNYIPKFMKTVWFNFSKESLTLADKADLEQLVSVYTKIFYNYSNYWIETKKLLKINFEETRISIPLNSFWKQYLVFVSEHHGKISYGWLLDEEIREKGSEILPIDKISSNFNQLELTKKFLEENYDPQVIDLPIDQMYQLVISELSSWWKRLLRRGKYKKLVKALEHYSKMASITGLNFKQLVNDLNHIRNYIKLQNWKREREPAFKLVLEKHYRAHLTDWANVGALLSLAKDGSNLIFHIHESFTKLGFFAFNFTDNKGISRKSELKILPSALAQTLSAEREEPFLNSLITTLENLSQSIKNIEEINVTLNNYFSVGGFDTRTVDDTLDYMNQLESTLSEAHVYIQLRSLFRRVEKTELNDFFSEMIKRNLPVNQLMSSYNKQIYLTIIQHYQEEFPNLQWPKDRRDGIVNNFAELDLLSIKSAPGRIKSFYASKEDQRLSLWADRPLGEERILRREFEKKRRHLPIRYAFKLAPKKIMQLKPVMFLSPLSVSYFLDPDLIKFDLVIFDEASQIRPEDALGAFIRGKQVIIVGDSKQMPPTSFFSASTFDDEDLFNTDLDDLTEGQFIDGAIPLDTSQFSAESILEACNFAGFPSMMLRFHYRSKKEDLIAFSNSYFYHNRLFTFPSPFKTSSGLELVWVENGVYDRGRSRTNRDEAKKAADIVTQVLNENPNASIGVVGFSKAQESAIEDAFENHNVLGDNLEELLSREKEPLFIKNLETVQGDERDIIIISIGYGKDHTGKFIQNFGPVTKFGGERRFNVLISRAREKVYILTSVHPSEYPSASKNRNFEMVRQYLLWAHTHNKIHLNPSTSPQSVGDIESPFEEAVQSFLTEKGHHVDPQVGVSGYRIDLAVVHPETNQYALAIECDGASYHSSKTARDRDRIREGVLRNLGWDFHRIWSNDWFYNPINAKTALIQAITTALNTHKYRLDDIKQKGKQVIDEDDTIEDNLFTRSKRKTKKKDSKQLIGTNYKRAPVRSASEGLYLTRNYSSQGEKYYKRQELLRRQIGSIIRNESPIHHELLLKSILRGWDQKVLTKKARMIIEDEIRRVEWDYHRSDQFYWKDQEIQRHWINVPIRRPSSARSDIEHISPEEIAVLITHIMKDQGSLLENEIFRAVSYFFEENTRVTGKELKKYQEALKLVHQADLIELIEGYWRWNQEKNIELKQEIETEKERIVQKQNVDYFSQPQVVSLKGIKYEGRDKNLRGAKRGDILTLKRDQFNPYDTNAVKVYYKGRDVGFVPKNTARYLGPAMDQGYNFSAIIVDYNVPYYYNFPVVKMQITLIRDS